MDGFEAHFDGPGGDAFGDEPGGVFGAGGHADAGGAVPGAGAATPVGPDAVCGLGDAVALVNGAAGTGMVIGIGGELFDLGPGTADSDADGVADSVTLADDRGLSIFTDADGDGTVDHVTTVLFDGTWETWSADGEIPSARTDVCVPGESGGGVSGDATLPAGGNPVGVDGPRSEAPPTPAAWDATAWERREHGRWA